MVSQKSDSEANPTFEDGRVTVCVRARPLLGRERKASGMAVCLRFVEGRQIQVMDSVTNGNGKATARTINANANCVEDSGDVVARRASRVFTFDHAYDPEISQEQVYTHVGAPMVESSFKGFNTCVFAYGQTGSGKSYCMMGPEGGRQMDSNPGLIPRLCENLFREIEERKAANADERERAQGELHTLAQSRAAQDDSASFPPPNAPPELSIVVYVSYIEIYREKVRCLLHPDQATPDNLRVREHPSLGVYVEGLSEVPVSNVGQVLELLRAGNRNRHTAATGMNDVSSRSHAIFALHLHQLRKRPGKDGTITTTELASRISLVDLAGSERVKSSGAEGETLKEGAQINKSLTTLGLVISTLAENSRRISPKHVPYRDSTLTFLLRDSLGGNSKTFMLATISPALGSMDETVSTLRYADRAKSILTRAFVNETASSKRIRELEEEVARLRERIRLLQAGGGPATRCRLSPVLAEPPHGPARVPGEEFDRESLDMEGMRSEVETMEEMMRRLRATNAQREQEVATILAAYKAESTVRINRNDPYLLNLDGVGGWVVAHLVGAEILLGDYAGKAAPPATEPNTAKPRYQTIFLCASDYADALGAPVPVLGAPHCVLEAQPSGAFTVRACSSYETYVNGELLPFSADSSPDSSKGDATQTPRSHAVLLQSGDVLQLGLDGPQLKLVDPTVPCLTARGRRPMFHTTPSFTDPSDSMMSVEAARRGPGPTMAQKPPAPARTRPVLDVHACGTGRTARGVRARVQDALSSPATVVTFLDSSLTTNRSGEGISPTLSQQSSASRTSQQRRPVVPALQLGNLLKPTQLFTAGMKSNAGAAALSAPAADENNHKSPIPIPVAQSQSQQQQQHSTALPRYTDGSHRCLSSRGLGSHTSLTQVPSAALQGRVVASSSPTRSNSRMPLSARVLKAGSAQRRSASLVDVSHSPKFSAEPERFIGGHNFVFLGPTQSGKTTTQENLKVPDRWYSFLVRDRAPVVGPTWGLQRSTLTVAGAETVELLLTELSGLPCFSILQDHLPTRRVTYMLCFSLTTPNLSLEMFHQTLEYILCHNDHYDAAVVLLATHLDQYRCTDQELYGLMEGMGQQVHDFFELLQPNAELRPSIVGRFAVDNVRRRVFSAAFSKMRTVGDLLHWMGDHALHRCKNDLDFRHGRLPLRWERLRNLALSLRVNPRTWCLVLSDYKKRAKAIDPRYSRPDELHLHTQLLMHLGVLEHRFRHPQMRSLVVMDVDWFLRLLGCIAFCGPIAAGDPDLMALCCFDLMRQLDNARRLPFRWSDVIAADQYGLLSKGIFTTKVFQVLLAGILSEKGAEQPRLSMIMNILESCDCIIRGSRLCFSTLPSSASSSSPYASSSESTEAPGQRNCIQEGEEDFLAENTPTKPESFLLLPTNFFHRPALAIIDYLPRLLTGPFYRFTFNMVPLHFFSKLTCRLAHAAAHGVYVGPVQPWPIEADRPYMPLVETERASEPRSENRNTSSAMTPDKAVIPNDHRFWQNAVWALGPAGNRAFIRMVHHSLFISFYSTEELAPRNGAAAGFFDALLHLIREAIQESPGAQCQEGLLCVTEDFAPGSCSFFPETGQRERDCTAVPPDLRSSSGDRAEARIRDQPFPCYYCVVDENINAFDKIREAEQYALQTARYRRTRQRLRARGATPPDEDEGDDEELELAPFLRNFSSKLDCDAFLKALESNADPPADLPRKDILRQALEEWNTRLVEGLRLAAARRLVTGKDDDIATHQARLGRALDAVVDALARW